MSSDIEAKAPSAVEEESAAAAATPVSNQKAASDASPAPPTTSPTTSGGTPLGQVCTVGELAEAFDTISELASQPLESMAAFKVLRLIKAMRPLMQRVVKARMDKATQLGTDIGGGKWQLTPEQTEKYQAALKPMLMEPVPMIPELKLTLADLHGAKLTPLALEKLGPVLKDA